MQTKSSSKPKPRPKPRRKVKGQGDSTPLKMTPDEATQILARPIDETDYYRRLLAYEMLREVWTLERCQMMCQMEIESATGEKQAGIRLSWGRELNSLKKAMLAHETEMARTDVHHHYHAPE